MLLLPSGVAGRSASWQFAAPFCSAPAAYAIETVPERMALTAAEILHCQGASAPPQQADSPPPRSIVPSVPHPDI